jgi:hypothetical protein
MDLQLVIAILLLAVAAGFLFYKYVGKRWVTANKSSGNCGPNCKCE